MLILHSGESKGDWIGVTSAKDTAGYRRLVDTRPVATILLVWALRQDGERGSLSFLWGVGGGTSQRRLDGLLLLLLLLQLSPRLGAFPLTGCTTYRIKLIN